MCRIYFPKEISQKCLHWVVMKLQIKMMSTQAEYFLWNIVNVVHQQLTKCMYCSGLVSGWNLDPAVCDTSGACDDTDTPWGYAKSLADETLAYSLNDGWNSDGSMSRSSNKIPYQDWRSNPYIPRNSPWYVLRRQSGCKWRNMVRKSSQMRLPIRFFFLLWIFTSTQIANFPFR